MAYRADMSEEERKSRNRAKTAAFRARQKQRMANDPEYAAEVKAKRSVSDKEQYNKEDPEERNRKWREWHANKMQTDPKYVESKRIATRTWQKNNPEKVAEGYRSWYAKNDRSEYNLAWSRANRDKRHETARRRKALEKGATDIEAFTKAEVWESFDGICGICLKPADPDNWHLDHIIPLSRGGQHVYVNVQVSHPRCNLVKKNKLPSEMDYSKLEVNFYGD